MTDGKKWQRFESPDCSRFSSVPLEWRDGHQQYAQCRMFVRNYTQIVRYLDARTPLDLSRDQQFQHRNDEFETQPCQNGWTYDRRTFPNTVVMEVSLMPQC